jgi:hypothetical protein
LFIRNKKIIFNILNFCFIVRLSKKLKEMINNNQKNGSIIVNKTIIIIKSEKTNSGVEARFKMSKSKTQRPLSSSSSSSTSDTIEYRGLKDELLYTIDALRPSWSGHAPTNALSGESLDSRLFGAQFWLNAVLRAYGAAIRLPIVGAPSTLLPRSLLLAAEHCRSLHQHCLSACGQYLAVVESDRIALRCAADEFRVASTLLSLSSSSSSSSSTSNNVVNDRWRHVCWSDDSRLLIVASSDARIDIISREHSTLVATINGKCTEKTKKFYSLRKNQIHLGDELGCVDGIASIAMRRSVCDFKDTIECFEVNIIWVCFVCFFFFFFRKKMFITINFFDIVVDIRIRWNFTTITFANDNHQ